jgi:hypothetical protein
MITAPFLIRSTAFPITAADQKVVIRIIPAFAIRYQNPQSLTLAKHWIAYFSNRFRVVPGFVVSRSHQIIPWPNRFRILKLSERTGVCLGVRWTPEMRWGIISLLLFWPKSLNWIRLLAVTAQRLLRLVGMLVSQNLPLF